jgi:hypothetical protein
VSRRSATLLPGHGDTAPWLQQACLLNSPLDTQPDRQVRSEVRSKKNRVGVFRRDFVLELLDKSGFGLLRLCCFIALRFQLSELLCRKNFFRLFKECLPAFLCAACLHAFSLPRLYLCLLIWREIERRQIDARH